MDSKGIPVTLVGPAGAASALSGPGSQPGEEDGATLDCLDLPREISAWQRPVLPDTDEVRDMTGAMQALDWLQQALDGYRPGAAAHVAADITALDADNRELVNQVLGEGEVSIRCDGEVRARVQESVLAGVWRTFHLDGDDMPVRDLLEIGDLPALARQRAAGDVPDLRQLADAAPPDGVINARPILSELAEHLHSRAAGQPAHVVNLTLLPLTEQDLAYLDRVLGRGPVAMLSRGYGECRVTGTAVPDIWWVRFYNSTGKLILNTLEVVDVPVVVRAAPEDLEDSARRLRDLLEPYAELRTAPGTA